ncbi:concanavalin A-like lectin/glucanase domain-containing protein [Diaporthe sp. PMI_573]|nr:concanavalin A-like lectin/glucanase domain-containing protein [Diaporthaceae sp. PMI_573]
MLWDHRQRPLLFEGICLQEYDPVQKALVGRRKNIFTGSPLGLAEGPHLYKRGGWYYLLAAEGGTGYHHACTLARSRGIWGPYELHPQRQILSAKDNPFLALQNAGHGDIVDTADGRTYLVHLTSRPVGQDRRCVLGRETAIQEAEWRDDWLFVKNGPEPSLYVDLPGARDDDAYWAPRYYSFEKGLHQDFQWLRTPNPGHIFSTEGGKLTLLGRESIGSWFEQALVARRQTHFSYDAETTVDFSPDDGRQYAGLTAYYSRCSFFYLAVTAHSDGQRELVFLNVSKPENDGRLDAPPMEPVKLPPTGKVKLGLQIRGEKLQFFYALQDEELRAVGPDFQASMLSDEGAVLLGGIAFTGAFVGDGMFGLERTGQKGQI